MNFDELITPDKHYWIIDHTSTTYDVKEEIKSWAGFWNKDHKCWEIINPDDQTKSVLKAIGVKLRYRGELR